MQIKEIPSPTFLLNENGKVTIMIPELKGEPENPQVIKVNENTLFFKRTQDAGCPLTDIGEDAMTALSKVEKCLMIELDLETVVDLYEQDSAELESSFRRVYEIDVVHSDEAQNN